MVSKNLLLQMLAKTVIFKMPESITLSSGKQSNYYIDMRLATTNPRIAPLLVDMLKDKIGNDAASVGGPELGIIPILGGLAAKGYFPTFIIRKRRKQYGLKRLVEGNVDPSKVVIVDDVATTGKSLLEAIVTFKKEYPVANIAKVIALIDREEGAKELLEEHGYRLDCLFTAKELLAIGEN